MPVARLTGSIEDDHQVWALQAFGLSVRSSLPLIGSLPGPVEVNGSVVEVGELDPDDDARTALDGAMLVERRLDDGSLVMRITRDEAGGYRIDTSRHGTFTISSDGSTISCGDLVDPAWEWHRPLYAQALPLAAVLQGFEPLHASAVALMGHAIAFVAPSGMGKTSLAVHLVARGARPVADDVVSLERHESMLLAHPGVALANIASDQMEALSRAPGSRLGRRVGTSDKVHVEMANMQPEPLPLGAIFFLRRSERTPRISFERAEPPDPRDLLGATFIWHVLEPARLVRQLETCVEISASVPVFRLLAPVSASPALLAAAVERRLKSLVVGGTAQSSSSFDS